jgi:hypothetical protein
MACLIVDELRDHGDLDQTASPPISRGTPGTDRRDLVAVTRLLITEEFMVTTNVMTTGGDARISILAAGDAGCAPWNSDRHRLRSSGGIHMVKTRPPAITGICILGFMGVALSLISLIGAMATSAISLPGWYPPYLLVGSMISLTGMIGMWKMRRWGAWTYTGLVAVNQVVLLATGFWSILALVIPGIVVAIALSHLQQME